MVGQIERWTDRHTLLKRNHLFPVFPFTKFISMKPTSLVCSSGSGAGRDYSNWCKAWMNIPGIYTSRLFTICTESCMKNKGVTVLFCSVMQKCSLLKPVLKFCASIFFGCCCSGCWCCCCGQDGFISSTAELSLLSWFYTPCCCCYGEAGSGRLGWAGEVVPEIVSTRLRDNRSEFMNELQTNSPAREERQTKTFKTSGEAGEAIDIKIVLK